MRKIFFFLLFFTIVIGASSQTARVTGYVYNEEETVLKDVNIYIPSIQRGTTTDSSGYYELEVPANRRLQIRYSFTGYHTVVRTVNLKQGSVYPLDIHLLIETLDTITVTSTYKSRLDRMPPVDVKLFPGTQNIEDLIKSGGLGVSSNNEMSSTYSVRGGNFDENLIYVNDIEIYRPFLARSGQQEGLSFINSDLVEGIYFSSGGFDARYGDKMSSVLDIRYKDPVEKKGSASVSLMGTSFHFEGSTGAHFSYLTGFRYRANSYILNSLPTKGSYKPVFLDFQTLLYYSFNTKWRLSLLAYYSDNKYRFVPETRETEFGTVNEALRLTIYFDGQEITQFKTMMAATTLAYTGDNNVTWKFITSAFRSIETESFDVIGAYRLDELEKDLGSENFGEIAFTRGVGSFINHARNKLDAVVYNFNIIGGKEYDNFLFEWGARYQGEIIDDKLSEWQMLDSAGYSIPQTPEDEIVLDQLLKAKIDIASNRITGFLQGSWLRQRTDTIVLNGKKLNSISTWDFNAGVRANYWDFNNQVVVSPRASIKWIPSWYRAVNDSTIKRINVVLRFNTGFYYQPPFYRELRDLNGVLHPDVRAQRSIHFVLGGDYYFDLWDRTFKFTTELYYKALSSLNPYEVDNVRIRYYANNNAKGYAAGWDFKVNGEFIKGIESWATFSVMRTYEDIKDDSFTEYYNSDGEKIIPGYSFNNVVVDSATFYPGYIPRPTDQIATFSLYFQDEMPQWPTFKVHLNVMYGTRLPYGPPDFNRYRDTLRTPPYRRVDIGFSKQFLTHREKLKNPDFWNHIEDLWLSLEVFNLLGINNVISYQWIEDVTGRSYSVPNYLTSRRINLKLIVRF